MRGHFCLSARRPDRAKANSVTRLPGTRNTGMTERRSESPYLEALSRRVLIYDGAMGTNIQRYNLSADDFGGKALEGCNDNLVLTRPDVIQAIHESFLAVGCDVVETCTFQSTPRRLHEWGLGEYTRDINVGAAKLARAARSEEHTSELQSLRHLVCRL